MNDISILGEGRTKRRQDKQRIPESSHYEEGADEETNVREWAEANPEGDENPLEFSPLSPFRENSQSGLDNATVEGEEKEKEEEEKKPSEETEVVEAPMANTPVTQAIASHIEEIQTEISPEEVISKVCADVKSM